MILTITISVICSLVIIIFERGLNQNRQDMLRGLDHLDDLEYIAKIEDRLKAIEDSMPLNNFNTEVLEQINKLQGTISDIKVAVDVSTRTTMNVSSSINNLSTFADTTRGMVDENTRRLNEIQKP
jgi:methyl-accepting chemotaxis protein